jgi:TRAP-type C4-dicarboxylate transport system permease small subunit
MRAVYTSLMDKLYWLCIGICIVSIVVMTGLIFTGVIMRVGFLMGARFAEPLSIFFAVQLTMYGAAACYRAHVHLRLRVFVNMLPLMAQRVIEIVVHLLMGVIAVLMIIYGASLTHTTWFQSYPEFDYVKVGLVYSAIPGSGIVTLLFVIEAILFRHTEEEADEELQHALEHAEEERRRVDEQRLA